jgi:protein-S-isoprenylcysteine O-methyltransferase Ste14
MNPDLWTVGFIVMAGMCYLPFMWASFFHFKIQNRVPLGSIVIFIATQIGLAVFIFAVIQHPQSVPIAVPLYAISLALFVWTIVTTRQKELTVAFTNDPPQQMLNAGPYQFVRHPFYLSYLIFWLANATATSTWWPWLVLAFMCGLYTVAAKKEEKKFRNSALASFYEEYRHRSGMFLPLMRWPSKG